MSLAENGNGMVMPVGPMYGNGGFGNGFGGDGWWVILFLFALMGNNGWGGFGGGNGGQLYPWMNQSDQINGGFRDQMINGNINSIRDNLNNLQVANMQQTFDISSQLANCCCENRLATANLGATIASEACATRSADFQNTQSLLNTINGGIQSIKDQLCQDKIDAKNDEISQLRQEILYARGQASQVQQNATIVNDIYNRLNQCPVGTVPVYGEQPIFTCNNGTGCNCNRNTFYN